VVGQSVVLRGRVLDAESGKPLPDVGIGIQGTEEHVHARTGEDGVFELGGIVPGRTLWLQARAFNGYIGEEREEVVPTGKSVVEMRPFRVLRIDAVPSAQGAATVGFMVVEREDGLYVAGVGAGSPAERMGVTVGDKLQSIAGRPTDGLGRNAIQFMLRGNPGTRVDVELRAADGRRRIVSLERGVRD